MKKMMVMALGALTLIGAAPAALAQGADTAAIVAQQEAMKKLDWMDGVWRGPAVTQGPQGEHRVTQTERIGGFLGGTLKMMEGKGYNADGSVGFNAFGVVSYDAASKAYSLTSWAQGRAGKFPMTVTDNGYVWEIPAGPQAVIRYTATLANGTWTEVGDYVANGQPPRRFFTMTLKRAGDSPWPSAGGITRE